MPSASSGCATATPHTARWVEDLRQLASRTGMRELVVRSLLHGAALGQDGDAEAAALLARHIDNPALAGSARRRHASTRRVQSAARSRG